MGTDVSGLPVLYRITPADIEPDRFEQLQTLLGIGQACIIQLRLPKWPLADVRQLASLVAARPGCVKVLLNADIEGAATAEANVGVHLKSAQLMSVKARPLSADRLVAASCHNDAQLDRAVDLGVDFVTVSPVAQTSTHPDTSPLGWSRFRDLVRDCPIPVYALGGMSPDDLADAIACGAHGVAGIRSFWPREAHKVQRGSDLL